jgi:hypothetical protein
MAQRSVLILLVALLAGAFAARGLAPARAVDEETALTVRAIVAGLSRDVLADVSISSVAVVAAGTSSVEFVYRLQNAGDGEVDLGAFTLQAWFSADAELQKDRDLQGAIIGLATLLRPGEAFESRAAASNGDAILGAYPYLILEVDSAGTVPESAFFNNTFALRRPPPDLVFSVLVTWDLARQEARIEWTFRDSYGIPDYGFRVEVPGFGAQIVGPGVRTAVVGFSRVTGARPCSASVAPLNKDGTPGPARQSNNLCAPGG